MLRVEYVPGFLSQTRTQTHLNTQTRLKTVTKKWTHIEERQTENHHWSQVSPVQNRGSGVIREGTGVFQKINQEAMRLFDAASSDIEEDYLTWNYSAHLIVIQLVGDVVIPII